MSKRDLLAFVLGAIVAVLVVYSMVERQAQWENRTLACWPTKDDPNPMRHP